MTAVRSGTFATLGGRTFAVRALRTHRWREVVDGRMVEPDLSPDDFDEIIMVTTRGRVLGHGFEITSAPGDDVEIYGFNVPDRVRVELDLEGSPYDGWRGRVPAGRVEELHEDVRVDRPQQSDPEDDR